MTVRNQPAPYQLEASILKELKWSFAEAHWDYVTAKLANQNWKLLLEKRGIACQGWSSGPAGPAG